MDQRSNDVSRPPVRRGQIIAGIVLAGIGLLLLFDRFVFGSADALLRLWPLIVVGVGLGRLIAAEEREAQRSALVVTFVGGWLLLASLGTLGLDYGNSWALVLVGFGLASLLRPDDRHDASSGAGLVLLGAALLAITRGWFGLDWSNGWPLLVILVGLSMVTRSLGLRGRSRRLTDES